MHALNGRNRHILGRVVEVNKVTKRCAVASSIEAGAPLTIVQGVIRYGVYVATTDSLILSFRGVSLSSGFTMMGDFVSYLPCHDDIEEFQVGECGNEKTEGTCRRCSNFG